jgi:hypothetical protein
MIWSLLTKIVHEIKTGATAEFHHAGFGIALPTTNLPNEIYA